MDRFTIVNCDLCGSSNYKKLFNKEGYTIVRCKKCGLAYIRRRLNKNVLKQKYNSGELSPVEYYKKTRSVDERTFNERLKIIEQFISHGQFLDIGCSIGTFMDVAKSRGWEVIGVDLNKEAVKECKKRKLQTIHSDINSFTSNKRYDLVVMSDLIEHVSYPTKILRRCRQLLKNDGFILISTPDFGSLLSRIMRAKWFHIKPKEHLYYFDKKTIGEILNETGYRVVFIKNCQRYRDTIAMLNHVPLLRLFEPFFRRFVPHGMKLYLNDELLVLAKKK